MDQRQAMMIDRLLLLERERLSLLQGIHMGQIIIMHNNKTVI
jgi:hypothetical protein